MDWIEVLAYGVSGALGALFAYLVVGDKKERRGVYTIVTVIAMFGVHSLAARFVLPSIYDWQTDRELRKIAVFSEIADSDPQAYKEMRANMVEGMKKGEPRGVIQSQVSALIERVLPRYIANASDESVNAFVNVVSGEAQDLNRANPDACYQFLFPAKSVSPNPGGLIDDTKKEKTLSAIADILHSSTHNPQPPPDKEESEALLEPIRNGLAEKYGADLLLVQGSAKDKSEREKVCNVGIDLYKRTLNLPPKQSSEVLRYLLSSR